MTDEKINEIIIMKHILLILLIFILSFNTVSAETVSIEIYENSSGGYFLSVNDAALIPCISSKCEITVNNVTSSNLSGINVKDLARRISLEMDAVNPVDTFNDTEIKAIFNTVIEEKQMADRAWISTTWMPETIKYNNCTLELEQSKGALNTLDAKFAGYDGNIQSKQDSIDMLKDQLEIYKYLIIILTAGIFILLISKSEFIRALREWKEK